MVGEDEEVDNGKGAAADEASGGEIDGVITGGVLGVAVEVIGGTLGVMTEGVLGGVGEVIGVTLGVMTGVVLGVAGEVIGDAIAGVLGLTTGNILGVEMGEGGPEAAGDGFCNCSNSRPTAS
jgi:hypothetical protein